MRLRNYFSGFIVTLCPCMTILILGTLEVFNGNSSQLDFGIGDFLPFFVVLSLALCILGGAISLVPMLDKAYFAVLMWGGIASYIQIMFLNSHLGEMNGVKIVWRERMDLIIPNTIIWLIVLIVACVVILLKKNGYRQIFTYIAGTMIVIQLFAVISILVQNGFQHAAEQVYAIKSDNLYEVGTDKNVIVIVLDATSSWDFENLLMKNPQLKDDYKDFVYYDNACSVYGATFPSLLHMLTGVDPSFKGACREWKDNAWNDDRCIAFYNEMHALGYTCELYSTNSIGIFGNLENARTEFDNIDLVKMTVDKKRLYQVLTQMAFYRAAPYWYKDPLEIYSDPFSTCVVLDNSDVRHENADFYSGLIEYGLKAGPSRKYMFIHLKGMHPPYLNDDKCVFTQDSTLENTRQGVAVMMREYLNQLKALGVYDDSAIIITADHGSELYITDKMDNQPVFLYKKADSKQDCMITTSAPISHDDLLATVIQSAGGNSSRYGTSILDWGEGDERERVLEERGSENFYHFTGDRFDLLESKTKGDYVHIDMPSDWR